MDFNSKEEIRTHIWKLLEEKNITTFPRPCKGRIPNFVGSDEACNRLKDLHEFSSAKCIFSAPDYILTRARELVLQRKKVLAVATPHMRKFLEISNIPENKIKKATSIRGFELCGKRLSTEIDLMIQGSVAVDRKGNRIGKGRGYGDREFHVLKTLGMLNPHMKIVTMVHETQVFDDFSSLMNEQDVKVNYILTTEKIIQVR